jgi:hypothetical protein
MTCPNSAGMVERPVCAGDKEKFRRIKQEMKTAQNNLFLQESTVEKVVLSKADIQILFYPKTPKKQRFIDAGPFPYFGFFLFCGTENFRPSLPLRAMPEIRYGSPPWPKKQPGHSPHLAFLVPPSFGNESTAGLDTTRLRLISRWSGIGQGYPSGPGPNGPISRL